VAAVMTISATASSIEESSPLLSQLPDDLPGRR
jgi:hypothetical protein